MKTTSTKKNSRSNRSDSATMSGNSHTHAACDVSDESLIVQYRQTGDRALYETLMQRYEREIYNYLRRYLGDSELAEDAFQCTFLQVHLKCQQFDSSRRFRPWLYAIATNQAIDIQRRNKRHKMVSVDRAFGNDSDSTGSNGWSDHLVGDTPDPLLVASDQENSRWIHQSVDSLGESMKQVIHLVYYQGMKYREAAETLDIPVGTVKSRLHAAVGRLGLMWNDSHRTDPEV